MKQKLKNIAQNPALKKSLHSMKPQKSLWGFLGVVLFFILPEIVALIWGEAITTYARQGNAVAPSYYYDALLFLFEGGGSFVNLALGVALLVWLFF